MMSEKQLKFLEFVPLILFITFVRSTGAPDDGLKWTISFLFGGVAAFFTLITLQRNKVIFNRITLGVNLFLISGALAALSHLEILMNLYRDFNPAPMFAWVIAVGLVTTFFSPHGFVGATGQDPGKIRLKSIFLMIAAVLAFIISFFFRENIVYSDILPFIGLFIVNDRLLPR